MTQIANGDILVVIPGILGSNLRRQSKQTWGYKNLALNLHRLASRLAEDLTLPANAFEAPEAGYDDGTLAAGIMKTQGIIPGFWSIDGYDDLLSTLRARFKESRQDIYEFPYDWRQSNEFTARRLSSFIEPLILRRQEEQPGARVLLVGHSMGGLVAKYYAECLDEKKHTRRVITIGTPYLGAVKALDILANRYVRFGPVRLNLGELARSLPSVAELLPMYNCIGPSIDEAETLERVRLPQLPDHALNRCLAFHRKLRQAVAANGDRRPVYHALLSHRQRTELWAHLNEKGGEVQIEKSTDFENGGDGTVPRCSATPPEWHDDSTGIYITGRHSTLQNQRETLSQLYGVVTAQPRRGQAVIDELSVDASSYASPEDPWNINAYSTDGSDSLVLAVRLINNVAPHDSPISEVTLKPQGGGLYSAVIRIAQSGIFRWTVHADPMAATPIDPVSDILLCADA